MRDRAPLYRRENQGQALSCYMLVTISRSGSSKSRAVFLQDPGKPLFSTCSDQLIGLEDCCLPFTPLSYTLPRNPALHTWLCLDALSARPPRVGSSNWMRTSVHASSMGLTANPQEGETWTFGGEKNLTLIIKCRYSHSK